MPTLSHCIAHLPLAALLLLGPLAAAAPVRAQSLIGSKASLVRQSQAARAHGYTYLRTTSQVNEFVRRGLLVRVPGNSSYRVADVSFPYARPEVKTFLARLGQQYRNACGERLVVTSMTRPTSRQPSNASPLSVHPTGMAVDLRRSNRPACRAFLEKTLLTLEDRGVLEATRESHPPHYHVSLFPDPYRRYVVARGGASEAPAKRRRSQKEVALASSKSYRVRGGDSLWQIAKRHGTSVERIKRANNFRSSRLKAGQVIAIPVTR
jgi:hypothetical protein